MFHAKSEQLCQNTDGKQVGGEHKHSTNPCQHLSSAWKQIWHFLSSISDVTEFVTRNLLKLENYKYHLFAGDKTNSETYQPSHVS
jgi:hypothetical protein